MTTSSSISVKAARRFRMKNHLSDNDGGMTVGDPRESARWRAGSHASGRRQRSGRRIHFRGPGAAHEIPDLTGRHRLCSGDVDAPELRELPQSPGPEAPVRPACGWWRRSRNPWGSRPGGRSIDGPTQIGAAGSGAETTNPHCGTGSSRAPASPRQWFEPHEAGNERSRCGNRRCLRTGWPRARPWPRRRGNRLVIERLACGHQERRGELPASTDSVGTGPACRTPGVGVRW